MDFRETFGRLDPGLWTDGYLPAWSSRAAAAATLTTGAAGLELSIPVGQGAWCPDTHDPPLRVSAIHSANRSGPVGSTDAQQPFREGLTVREEQATMLGFAPHFGTIAVTASAELDARSMFSAWLVGLEDRPDRCGEICLIEVFGDAVDGAAAAVGQGIHAFRDPVLREDFSAKVRTIDVARPHTYAVGWAPGRVEFLIDGVATRVCDQAPDYPMMLILGVFDFPGREGGIPGFVPRMRVTEIVGTGLGAGSLVAP